MDEFLVLPLMPFTFQDLKKAESNAILAQKISISELKEIYDASNGNSFILTELLNNHYAGSNSLSSIAVETFNDQLNGIHADSRRALDVLSVLQEPADTELIASFFSYNKVQAAAIIKELTDVSILVPFPENPDKAVFKYPQMKAFIRGKLSLLELQGIRDRLSQLIG